MTRYSFSLHGAIIVYEHQRVKIITKTPFFFKFYLKGKRRTFCFDDKSSRFATNQALMTDVTSGIGTSSAPARFLLLHKFV